MAYATSYQTQLATMKRKAGLSGREVTRQEVAGLTEGHARAASSRLYYGKTIELGQQRIDLQKEQFETGLAENKRQFETEQGREKEEFNTLYGPGGYYESTREDQQAFALQQSLAAQEFQAGQQKLRLAHQKSIAEADRAQRGSEFDYLYGSGDDGNTGEMTLHGPLPEYPLGEMTLHGPLPAYPPYEDPNEYEKWYRDEYTGHGPI